MGEASPSTLEARFWPKVDKNGPVPDFAPHLGPCWLWTASLHTAGYGQIGLGKRPHLAHRVAYELVVGPIPYGLSLDHLCRVRRCVNPTHLEPVTHAENMARGGNSLKTHCPSGHPYDEANTYIYPNGAGRHCRACDRLRQAEAKRIRRSL